MRGSSLTTFLMFLPLIAIPLLAIFGVPEFTPVNASTPTEQGATAITLNEVAGKSPARVPDGRNPAGGNDVFSPFDAKSNVAPGFPGQTLKTESDPFLNVRQPDPVSRDNEKQGLGGWEINPPNGAGKPAVELNDTRSSTNKPIVKQSSNSATALHSVASTPDSAEAGFTWKTAVRTLNRMGIKDFLLQPGTRSEEFHFSCVYSSPSNPRVAHRFEAEDPDPLQAVQKVLKQIQTRP